MIHRLEIEEEEESLHIRIARVCLYYIDYPVFVFFSFLFAKWISLNDVKGKVESRFFDSINDWFNNLMSTYVFVSSSSSSFTFVDITA